MVKVWVVFIVALLVMLAGAVNTFGQTPEDGTPLLPHPSERFKKPVYSQDHYKRDPTPVPAPNEYEPPTYSQDKYETPPSNENYSKELRNVPAKGREWSEIEIAKGIVSLNSQSFDEAIKHFEAALKQDPRNFVALEYISSTYERRGDFNMAIGFLAKAKHLAPKGRWGQINFQIGRLYLALKNYERSEIYLRLALLQGGQVTAVNYTLGYLLYLEERFFEAEYYLHDARMRAIRRTALIPERQMIQAIDYYLGEIYARLGFLQYSVVMLRGTELGDSWEVRQGAWRVHSELNKMNFYLTLGEFGQYDSNVAIVPVGGTLPVDFSSSSSFGNVLTLNTGWQTSPAKAWVFGVDGMGYWNTHFNNTLGPFDVLEFGLDGWANYWNRHDWSYVARWGYTDILTDRSNFTQFQSTTDLSLSANYFPYQRWNWEAGFQYRIDGFTSDLPTGPDRRSGHTYVGFTRISLKAPNPRLRPTFAYTFEANAAVGENFQAKNHIFLLEADWRLFSKTHLIGGVTFEKSYFPNNVQGRRDTVQQLKIGVSQLFSDHWLGLINMTQIGDESTLPSFSYSRLVMTGGATYTF